jgi:hypothetical protein
MVMLRKRATDILRCYSLGDGKDGRHTNDQNVEMVGEIRMILDELSDEERGKREEDCEVLGGTDRNTRTEVKKPPRASKAKGQQRAKNVSMGETPEFYSQKTAFQSLNKSDIETETPKGTPVVNLRSNVNASPPKKRTAHNVNANTNPNVNVSPPKPPLTIASKIQELEIESPVRAYAIGRKYTTPPKPNPTYATPERALKAQQQSSTKASTTYPNSNSQNFELTEAKNPNLVQKPKNLVQKVEKLPEESKTVEKPKPNSINPLKIQQKKDFREPPKDPSHPAPIRPNNDYWSKPSAPKKSNSVNPKPTSPTKDFQKNPKDA